MKILTAVIFLLLSISANAQTTAGNLRIQWALPTTGCDMPLANPPVCGKPLTGDAALIAINVFISTAPIPDDSPMAPTIALVGTATTATHNMTVPNGTRLYIRVKAINSGYASPFSNQIIKTINTAVRPNAPTSVSVELTITP